MKMKLVFILFPVFVFNIYGQSLLNDIILNEKSLIYSGTANYYDNSTKTLTHFDSLTVDSLIVDKDENTSFHTYWNYDSTGIKKGAYLNYMSGNYVLIVDNYNFKNDALFELFEYKSKNVVIYTSWRYKDGVTQEYVFYRKKIKKKKNSFSTYYIYAIAEFYEKKEKG